MTFRLYGPDTTPIVPTCDVGTLAFTHALVPIVNNGDGTATAESDEFMPTKAGTYFWIATYNGDANNEAVSGVCGDQGETSVVDKASPTISTSATNGTLPGASIHDVATVKGLTSDATGTVAFSLWNNADLHGCAGLHRHQAAGHGDLPPGVRDVGQLHGRQRGELQLDRVLLR